MNDRRSTSPSGDPEDVPPGPHRPRRESALTGTALRPLFVTIEQAAEMLTVSRSTLDRWQEDGVLVRVPVQKMLRYRLSDLESFADRLATGEEAFVRKPGPSRRRPP